jgi:hypothetical protein
MIKISKNIVSTLPEILDLDEMNQLLLDFMKNEDEELIYAFTDKKGNKCNQYFFTTHKLIISDRVPNSPFKLGKYMYTGWGGDLSIPYEFINEIHTVQNKSFFTRKKLDLTIYFKSFATFLSKKDTDNFLILLNLIKSYSI